MRPADTSPEAHGVQMAAFRRMTPGRRVELAMQLSDDVLEMVADGIRRRHPDYEPDQVVWAMRRVRLGDDLLRAAWPEAPLLSP